MLLGHLKIDPQELTATHNSLFLEAEQKDILHASVILVKGNGLLVILKVFVE